MEQLEDGNRVYLQRPAYLHNGFDFLVCVENTNYAPMDHSIRNYPKHEDLRSDLVLKKLSDPIMYNRLYDLLLMVYECHDVYPNEYADIHFTVGLPVDHILKTIKWLFIEQDIRYWNYSGREMTWGIVPGRAKKVTLCHMEICGKTVVSPSMGRLFAFLTLLCSINQYLCLFKGTGQVIRCPFFPGLFLLLDFVPVF